MKRTVPLLLVFVLLFSGCGVQSKPATAQFFAMDTLMSVTVYGRRAEENCTALQQEVNRLDGLWSRTRPDSEISRLNEAAGGEPVTLSQDTLTLLSRAVELHDLTDGALDVTIAPVMDTWGFGTAASFGEATYRVPPQSELDALLPFVNADRLVLTEDTGFLPVSGMAVDLGAMAKGRLSDLLRQQLMGDGVSSALLDLGGNITVLGNKPDGSPWKVGIKNPQNDSDYFCVLSLADKTCSTSGGYERYFEQDGVRYHHILDPKTGYPAETGLLSVTVVSQDGTLADALSTACFVLGPEKAEALWRSQGQALGFDLVLVRTDSQVLVTEGLQQGFDFQGEDAGYHYEILYR